MNDIANAINNRQLIEFDYDGHHRKVIPAACGSHISTGNDVLRGYQVGGTSATRPVPLWDMFIIAKISNLQVLVETFTELPPHYSRDDKHISPIVAQL